ncbi:MAG TPA: class I SAM-dependent methyltransferase [Gemmatirosa sp.]
MPIEHVSDTARWVAVYRAMESERPDALFRDPYARRLAGARGEAIVRTLKRGRATAWAMIVRTAVMDEMILHAVEREGVGLVLNLAAGLDARPWRLALPPALRWVDADFPAVLDYKRETLGGATAACAYEAVGVDLADADARRAFLARVGGDAPRTLVVSEGLLLYLAPAQVGALAADLHAAPSVAAWVTDLASPRLLALMQRSWGAAAARGNAPFRFAPAEGTDFFRPFGWREAQFRSAMEEAHRLRREMRGAWLWRALARLGPPARREEFRRMSAFIRLERA